MSTPMNAMLTAAEQPQRDLNGTPIYLGFTYPPHIALCGCVYKVKYIRNRYGLVPRADIISAGAGQHTHDGWIEGFRLRVR